MVASTSAAIMVLLENSNQLWNCSLCRHEKNHQAMGSQENPNCTSCGLHVSATVNTYVVSWLRGLMSKSGFGPDMDKTVSEPNYGMLAEKLLNPHGEQVGMCKPFFHKPGEEATCTCEKGKASKAASKPEKVGLVSKAVDDSTGVRLTWRLMSSRRN